MLHNPDREICQIVIIKKNLQVNDSSMATQNLTKETDTQSYPIHIPKNIQNEWSSLFSKQLYCIGKDILHKNNLLFQYGLSRERPPNPNKGSSQYSFTDETGKIILWGFGMVCATKNDGIFLGRHAFGPKLIKVDSLLSNIWEPDQILQYVLPKTTEETILMLRLLIKSIKWLENYESWVLTTCGQSYRNESLYGTSSKKIHDICLDKKWYELSEKFTKIQIKNNIL